MLWCPLHSDRPDLLIRAARHYEGAEQVLRRQAVLTATKVVNHRKCNDYFQLRHKSEDSNFSVPYNIIVMVSKFRQLVIIVRIYMTLGSFLSS